MSRVSQRTVPPVVAKRAAHGRHGSGLVALGLVALQLVMALHFALVPHGFSAGLAGFQHLHGGQAAHAGRAARGVARQASAPTPTPTPTIAPSNAPCATESCPIGFAGHHSVLLTGSGSADRLALVVTRQPAPLGCFVLPRQRALLSAPKTSPPV